MRENRFSKEKVGVSDKAGVAGEESRDWGVNRRRRAVGGGTGHQNSPDGCRSYRITSFHYLYGLNLFHFLFFF